MSINAINNDYSSANLAAVFGRRTIDRLAQGLDVAVSARLAATFAARVLDTEQLANCPTCDGYLIPNHTCPGGMSTYIICADSVSRYAEINPALQCWTIAAGARHATRFATRAEADAAVPPSSAQLAGH